MNVWDVLDRYSAHRVALAARQAAEQEHRLGYAKGQLATMDQYILQIQSRSAEWMKESSGCPAFLLSGVQHFQDTVRSVANTQRRVVEQVERTREDAYRHLQAERLEQKRMQSLTKRREARAAEQSRRREQAIHDNHTANRHLRTKW
ncbi:flagellar export protein FliJ [Acidithiobacillus caldus]|uniref:flagellar export protein FliJ n=1 Tax=Acidithiobacillus caldus TaxID=33059 RepID=UPI00056E52DD|nr:flagellar export protein FliJ [Acidithiobacillus caldus]MBU2729637.1 FliJ family protein [Acidithiobacillus caldus]MBU2734222.1 FliJ family protein [Acidithiobacillus caldus ATCC 51756]MBU2746068.1 FliJ family protein [Acidithiobacillus caldus]MBU2779677.1 FliJ family protein [Acidithiobacillus caldus]